MESIFNALLPKPQDQIFGLYQEYLLDERPEKINLGIGTYRNVDGSPYVLESVKQAELKLSQHVESKEYLPIDGDPVFLEEASKVLYGELKSSFIHFQTPGGGMALALTGEILKNSGISTVCISDETWPNHLNIFSHLEFKIERYPYYDRKTKSFQNDALISFLRKTKDAAVIFQPVCHNPTGVDVPKETWGEIFKICVQNRLVPIFDAAYLGMKDSFNQEMYPIFKALEMKLECFVTVSFSKNFGLYAERIGLLSVYTQGDRSVLQSNVKSLIRSIYSNPPQHGSQLIKEILQNHKDEWLDELKKMREQLKESRLLFENHTHLHYVANQHGMFSLLDLTEEQIKRLKTEFAIYLPLNGRINFAAINLTNIERIHDALTHIS